MDRSSRQRINKETANLKNTIDQKILADIYRKIHQTTAAYTLFSSSYGIFSSINHMLSYKTIISKFIKIVIIPNVFPDHNGMIPEINNRIINTKFNTFFQKKKKKEKKRECCSIHSIRTVLFGYKNHQIVKLQTNFLLNVNTNYQQNTNTSNTAAI